MLVVLPPSESKAAPPEGPRVDVRELAFPALAARREALLDALAALAAGPRAAALAALGLSEGQAAEIDRNASLREAPAAPAGAVYTGVLYERLRLGELPEAARARAARHVLIASALWGVLRPDDRIPAYRLSIGARLSGLPGLAAFWRPALRDALPDEGLVVDLRSGAYAAAWRPARAGHVTVRAYAELPNGTRKPISHMAKRARGDVARALLLAPSLPRSPADVATAAGAAGLRVELAPARGGWTLDVVEPAVQSARSAA